MDILAKDKRRGEQIRVAIYEIFHKKYFENKDKKRLSQLSRTELRDYFGEQRRFVDEEFQKFKGTLEKIVKDCGQEVVDRLCNILATSISGKKQIKEEYIRHREYLYSLCEKYKLYYFAEKLKKL